MNENAISMWYSLYYNTLSMCGIHHLYVSLSGIFGILRRDNPFCYSQMSYFTYECDSWTWIIGFFNI